MEYHVNVLIIEKTCPENFRARLLRVVSLRVLKAVNLILQPSGMSRVTVDRYNGGKRSSETLVVAVPIIPHISEGFLKLFHP